MSAEMNVPDGWKVKKVANFAKVKGGKRLPSGADFIQSKTLHPYIRVTDFLERTISFSAIKYIDNDTYEKIKRYIIHKDDVYISIAGTVGISGVIPEELHLGNLTENAAKICDIIDVDKNYLSYQLNSTDVQREIQSYIGAAVQPKLALFRIEKLQIKIPISRKEQQRIAKILSTLDQAIESSQKLIAKEKDIKKGLMHDLLTNGIDKNGKIRTPQTHNYKESELGLIPQEWEVTKIGNISRTFAGGTPSREEPAYYGGTIPWVKSGEVNQTRISKTEESITKEAIVNSSAKLIEKDTILIAMYGATAGQIAILDIEATSNQAVLAIPIENDNMDYVLYISTFHMPKLLFQAQGSGQPNLSKQLVDNLIVPRPKIDEQMKISNLLITQDQKIETEEKDLAKLKELKKGLMNDLLSGKVRV